MYLLYITHTNICTICTHVTCSARLAGRITRAQSAPELIMMKCSWEPKQITKFISVVLIHTDDCEKDIGFLYIQSKKNCIYNPKKYFIQTILKDKCA